MATSTDVIDAETMLSKVQIAFCWLYYKYDVALASLLSTCRNARKVWQYSRTGQTENFIFGKIKKKKTIWKKKKQLESLLSLFLWPLLWCCHWDYSYEQ